MFMWKGFQLDLERGGPASVVVDGVADGYEAFVAAGLAARTGNAPLLYVARDGQRVPALTDALKFVAPALPVLELPAWDCLPYDRVSPGADTAARRLDALAGLNALKREPHVAIVVTTVNALLQKMPPSAQVAARSFRVHVGNRIDMAELAEQVETNGFDRVSTVREVGEYAVRGGIVDLFAPGASAPLRLDFFGDTLESIRTFDPTSQRTSGQQAEFVLHPMSEIVLSRETIGRFRCGYIELFGAPSREDALYASISEGRRFAGMEHWLPLFHERLETVFDYLPNSPVVMEHLAREAVDERSGQISDYYDARRRRSDGRGIGEAVLYKPVPPDSMYLDGSAVETALSERASVDLSPFERPDAPGRRIVHAGSSAGRNFSPERNDPDANVFDRAAGHIAAVRSSAKRVLLAGWSEGSLNRLVEILGEHGLENGKKVETLEQAANLPVRQVALTVLRIETGFEAPDITVICEQDILGDRLVRRVRKKRAADFISEAASLSAGDVVVHADHGIGRFVGLRTIEAAGAPHDCLEVHYAGDDRLFLPVENIELLSRYGSDTADAALDRLGGVAWQSRKAKLKKKLLEMADELIRLAAAREMRGAPSITPPDGLYDEFAARFPYDETEDQQTAIDRVFDDLAAGRPMDRLICGDVGFGKTEIALRAAFLAAMEGFQVAVVVPTTLLSRQHHRTFADRFAGLPVKVRQASRLVGARELSETRKGLADGTVDIVIGTHALLGASISFGNLGLLIVDEEQHFGVRHKERLKTLKGDVHVLTLSATPIPRTLQLALTGVRELSLIATAPIDRLAVRTFISPFDPVIIRETLLREHYRGGQSFYVAPQVSDLPEIGSFLDEQVPEIKIATAHGQMAPGELDDVMNAFYGGKYDVLLSTAIVESGLDIPTANTLIVHRADMFGLAQLYQLRGRVGRSKLRAYSLFTLPAKGTPTATAERRLKALQSLDTLGAGFQLASHDLDIRGAGNLLGEEQSGHIREVGYELYRQMLEEAVAELKGEEEVADRGWSPQIAIGAPVMIPERYVPDLQLRLGLYRRLGDLDGAESIDAFAAELMDRFGPLPEEVRHLMKIVFIKVLCRKAAVEKLEAGPRGVVVQFRNNRFSNPGALVGFIGEQGSLAKIRPDQSVVFSRDWPDAEKRLSGAAAIVTRLAKLAEAAPAR